MYFNIMEKLYIGTSYHQIYAISLKNPSLPIEKYGQKKNSPIISLYSSLPSPSIHFADPYQLFSINPPQNDLISQNFIDRWKSDEKIVRYQGWNDVKIICTSYGDIYSKMIGDDDAGGKQNGEVGSKWTKLYHNDGYREMSKERENKYGNTCQQYRQTAIEKNSDEIEIAYVGRGLLPFVYSYCHQSTVWKAKNVSNDSLDLQIPPDDVDCCFINRNYHLAVAHAHNKIRIYDIKSRRRKPITDVTLTEVLKTEQVKICKMIKSDCEKYLYVGNERGSIYEVDLRKNCAVSSKIKGITTTIKDMKIFYEYLAVVSLDGYLRVFNLATKTKQFEKYLNVHPEVLMVGPCVLCLKSSESGKVQQGNYREEELLSEEEEDKKMVKVKKIRKRNKVGLRYLQVSTLQQCVKKQNRDQQQDIKQSLQQQAKEKRYEQRDEDLDL